MKWIGTKWSTFFELESSKVQVDGIVCILKSHWATEADYGLDVAVHPIPGEAEVYIAIWF